MYQPLQTPHKQTKGLCHVTLRCDGNFPPAWPAAAASSLPDMKLFAAALVTVAVGWGAVLASPTPPRRPEKARVERRAQANQACRARGPDCKLVMVKAARDGSTACVCG